MTTELIRVPNKDYPNPRGYRVPKYTYRTPDGRWHVEKQLHTCGGPEYWIIHTTGEHVTTVRTLSAAKAFLSEDLSADCIDCGIDTLPTDWSPRAEWYIVADDVWAAAGMTESGGCLCIDCLEKRLGRPLTAADFPTDIPVNDLDTTDEQRYAWSWRTPRLVDRLSKNPAHINPSQLPLPFDEEVNA